jgi:hypothetical protein
VPPEDTSYCRATQFFPNGRRRLHRRTGLSGERGGVVGGELLKGTGGAATFMTWNLLHLARILKDADGIPAHGNQRSGWDADCRYDFDNPDYR